MTRRFHEKEPIGASQFQQLAIRAKLANKIHSTREFAAQHRLCPEIVRIAIDVSAGKIILGVVSGGIKFGRLCAAKAALAALQDVASIGSKPQQVAGCAAA